MTDLQKIITAQSPLTLSSVPSGFAPLLLADLTRAAKARTMFIAPDDAAMRSIADAVPYFAPEIEILQLPGPCPGGRGAGLGKRDGRGFLR